ncbi:hypothetical protein HU200_033027 [Digitaria exilis]|uniref:C2H2-type domain-containing protein n=1 Tax=Digitaria exilis TaxID=1010633 RepID=A0A835ENU0_9POAL|nr:hypothetical protein HU200_033027 [Digitaria exilis]CAB3488086.1 unnamed protein product [Digitaria exilis]
MAPTSSSEEPAPVKHVHITHQFWKRHQLLQKQQQQLLLHHQRLKPAVIWGWPASTVGGHAPVDVGDEDDDGLGGAWPPRSYTCAFCRREFRSAQALGGHMNVHRRDRAKMRHGGGGAMAAQAQLGGAAAPATAEEAAPPHAAAGTTKYAVLYPILNSNAGGAVLIPGGDVLLSAPMALAPARERCHVSSDDDDDEEDKDVDLELRLWWP